MSFGNWLLRKREASGLTQTQLGQRAGISANYVSALERDEPNARDGSPRRPRIEKVDRIAKALGVPRDEARLAAGYAPETTGPPQTVADLLKAIERLGVEGIMFHDEEKLHELDAEQLQGILNSIRTVVEMDLARLMRKDS